MLFRRVVLTSLAVIVGIVLSSSGALAAAKAAPTGKVNINTAGVEQLKALPGIGPKLAARIVEYRQKAGAFKSTEELLNVKGIGEKNFAKLQPFLTIADSGAKGATSR